MANDPFYKSKEWYSVRGKALARDKYKCRMCGCSVRGKGNAHVDHIKDRKHYPHLALVLSNLQTLCSFHHNSTKARDENNPARGVDINGLPNDGRWT